MMAAEMGLDEEIHNFTALLSLPPNQVLPLLHDTWRLPNVPLTFPSNDTSASSSAAGHNSQTPNCAEQRSQRAAKRKEVDKGNKVKAVAKKSRNDGESEKLPYVHVRARRGEATDSHSLAERARREKINERMKLLQELVPGCSKISGTALVLDEIINHVQCLQRQVEFLSLRLAAVNPRIDFSSFDNFLSAEFGRVMACGDIPMPSSDFIMNGHQQIWVADSPLPFISTASSSTPTIPCSSPKTPSLTYEHHPYQLTRN